MAALAGTWTGTIDGSGGHDQFTMVLRADGTMTVGGTNGYYGAGTGTWTVSGAQFTATGHGGGGGVVNFSGIVSGNNLTGTWVFGADGGTFAVSKQ
jgi:hypothetical protein